MRLVRYSGDISEAYVACREKLFDKTCGI